jgi:hypothetical protein
MKRKGHHISELLLLLYDILVYGVTHQNFLALTPCHTIAHSHKITCPRLSTYKSSLYLKVLEEGNIS